MKRGIILVFLLVLILIAVIIVWKVAHKPSDINKDYYIKNGLCYSDFLENCEGKKVEVIGKIIKGKFCPKFETETYILCETDITVCKTRHYRYDYDCAYGAYHLYKGHYDNCLGLVQSCFTEDSSLKIKNEVEDLLLNPAGKTVKLTGKIFIERASEYASVSGKVGIIPETITVIEDEI